MTTRSMALGSAIILTLTACVAGCEKEGLKNGGATCSYGGKTYQSGASFPSTDGCNTCSCASDGQVACTLMSCVGDSGAPQNDASTVADLAADSAPGFDTPSVKNDANTGSKDTELTPDAGSDGILVPDAGREVVSAPDAGADGKPVADTGSDRKPATDAGSDGKPAPDAGDSGKDSTVTCSWQDASVPVGQSVSDGCNTCTCSDRGTMMCTLRACPVTDAAPSCVLQTALSFGYDGGMVAYQDRYSLDPTAGMTITRTDYRGVTDGSGVRTCSPPLPACGAASVVSVSTIVADLAADDVKAAFSQTTTPLFGVDSRPVDGAVWSISLASGGSILVGGSCPSPATSSCLAIPAGVQRLADDLKSLASAMAATSACSGL